MNVAILGAPATGKSWLARKLALAHPELRIADAPPLRPTHRHDFALTLLLGLDLPGPDTASTSTQARSEADAQLRATLQQEGIAYAVVYGYGEQRLRNALRLIAPEPALRRQWTWACEKCSDPDCEHQLFTGWRRSMAADRQPS